MDNIAEGFERDSKLELINSLSIAKGESGEVKSQLYRLLDRGYIDEVKFHELYKVADEIGNMLGSWIKYLNRSEIREVNLRVALVNQKLETSNSKQTDV